MTNNLDQALTRAEAAETERDHLRANLDDAHRLIAELRDTQHEDAAGGSSCSCRAFPGQDVGCDGGAGVATPQDGSQRVDRLVWDHREGPDRVVADLVPVLARYGVTLVEVQHGDDQHHVEVWRADRPMSAYELPAAPPNGTVLHDRHGRAWHRCDGWDHDNPGRWKRLWRCQRTLEVRGWVGLLVEGPLTEVSSDG